MATKAELLDEKTKDDLIKLADKAGEEKVKKSMKKSQMIDVLASSRKVKKSDL